MNKLLLEGNVLGKVGVLGGKNIVNTLSLDVVDLDQLTFALLGGLDHLLVGLHGLQKRCGGLELVGQLLLLALAQVDSGVEDLVDFGDLRERDERVGLSHLGQLVSGLVELLLHGLGAALGHHGSKLGDLKLGIKVLDVRRSVEKGVGKPSSLSVGPSQSSVVGHLLGSSSQLTVIEAQLLELGSQLVGEGLLLSLLDGPTLGNLLQQLLLLVGSPCELGLGSLGVGNHISAKPSSSGSHVVGGKSGFRGQTDADETTGGVERIIVESHVSRLLGVDGVISTDPCVLARVKLGSSLSVDDVRGLDIGSLGGLDTQSSTNRVLEVGLTSSSSLGGMSHERQGQKRHGLGARKGHREGSAGGSPGTDRGLNS